MTVRSQNIRSSQVVPRHAAESGAIVLLWIMAIVLWLASTFGNFVQFVGGWEYVWPLNGATVKGIAYALLYQGMMTIAQWGFKAKRWWFVYSIALLASAIPSFITYNSWANGWLVAHVARSAPADVAALLASLAILITAIVVDLIPEWVLVE